MSEQEARAIIVDRLMAKGAQALAAARRELDAGDAALASNRVYYACFYALSAVLLNKHLQFVKHSGVRAAMHQHLIRTGIVDSELGRFYDKAFAERQEADYNALATIDSTAVAGHIKVAEHFVETMRRLIANRAGDPIQGD